MVGHWKIAIASILISFVSWPSGKRVGLAGFLTALPLTTLLALAIVNNGKSQFLFDRGYDSVKDEYFYRPLGGGIEFQETGEEALKREFHEELDQEIRINNLAGTFENIFTFDGVKGHELIQMFDAEFVDKSVSDFQEIDVYESGQAIAKAVWRSIKEIHEEGAKLYPDGINVLLEKSISGIEKDGKD